MRGVEAPVAHDADVVDAAVAFDEVVAGDVDVIVVDVDRHRPVLAAGIGNAVRRNRDAVMEERHGVVRDRVARPVHLDRVVAVDGMRAIDAGARPAERAVVIVAADENVVRDIEARRSRKLGVDADPHALEPAVPDREPRGARDVFDAGPERHLGVPKRDPLEDVVGRAHHVEQPERAVAVEDHLAVARRFDHDRFLAAACRRSTPSGLRPAKSSPTSGIACWSFWSSRARS